MKRRNAARTAAAESDIREIFAYIGSDSSRAAQNFNDDLAATLDRLSEFPHSGYRIDTHSVPLWAARVSKRFHRYIIVYRLPGEDSLDVVRVLHGARDVRTELSGLE